MNNPDNLVLVGIDGSSLSGPVCDYAAWIARKVDAPLKLLHTIDHHPEQAEYADLSGNIGVDSRDHLLDELARLEQQRNRLRMQQGRQWLETARERVIRQGLAHPLTNQRHGSLIESLIELEQAIRVLVLGVRGKVHEDQPDKIGAKLESIIRTLHKPVLVVNAEFREPRRFMLVFDGSEASEKALEMVSSSPLYQGLSCHLVGVGREGEKAPRLQEAAHRLERTGGIEVIVKPLPGKPDEVLGRYETEAAIDLTVMGAFRHTRIHDWLLGSFTLQRLAHSHKPLLLLH